ALFSFLRTSSLHRSPLSLSLSSLLSSFLSSAANVWFAQKTQFHRLFLTVRNEDVSFSCVGASIGGYGCGREEPICDGVVWGSKDILMARLSWWR
ncbi:unnamed protein product, partial [Prunus brigantina]